MTHGLYCKYGYLHDYCVCSTAHTTRTIVCNTVAHQEEHDMTTDTTDIAELEARLAQLKAVTPEDVAAQAEDESDDEYDITPAADPDDEDEDEEPTPGPNALTAFLVVVALDGSSFGTAELDKMSEIVPSRQATVIDMRRAAGDLIHDINAMQISQQTVAIMQQSAQQLADQARSDKIAAKLASKNIVIPGRR